MATVEIQRESQERLQVPVTVPDQDPTVFPVEWAFPVRPDRPATWFMGTWLAGSASQAGTVWTAVVLTPIIGVGAVDLAEGRYDVYLRITSGGEVPVMLVGRVRVR